MCSHIAAQVLARSPIREPRFAISADYLGTVLGPTWLCGECAARFGVPPEGVTLTGDGGFDVFWGEVDWKPVCPGCYEACRAAPDGVPSG